MSPIFQLFAFFSVELVGESILGFLHDIFYPINRDKQLNFAKFLVEVMKKHFVLAKTESTKLLQQVLACWFYR